jgi:hypothetical protein
MTKISPKKAGCISEGRCAPHIYSLSKQRISGVYKYSVWRGQGEECSYTLQMTR